MTPIWNKARKGHQLFWTPCFMQYEITYCWCKTWQYLHRLFKKNPLPWCATYISLQQDSVHEHVHTNCKVNFRKRDTAEMGRKWQTVVYDLLHGELPVDLCSKSPTELVHDKFMSHVLLIAQCSSHVFLFPSPSLSTFWRQYSTSQGKLML